jgi:hypothetical protein
MKSSASKPVTMLSKLAAVVFAVLFSLLAAELLFRFHYFLNGDVFFGRSRLEVTSDARKGWKPTPRFAVQQTVQDFYGHAYNLVFHQNEEGFREFQDLSKRPRILVIGDSHTQARYASDDKTWFAEMGRRLHAQVFAYGAAGYGTLQELMVIEEFLDRIDPDAIILQVCTNDVVNNSVDLERLSLGNNPSPMVRPYYRLDGSVLYALPARAGVLGLMDSVPPWDSDVRLIRLARRAVMMTYIRLFNSQGIEAAIEKNPDIPLYRNALAVTEVLFKRIRAKAGARPLFAFVEGVYPPFQPDLEALLHKAGFIVISDVPVQMTKARKEGQEVGAADETHWNEKGNKMVGEIVARALNSWFPLQPESNAQ